MTDASLSSKKKKKKNKNKNKNKNENKKEPVADDVEEDKQGQNCYQLKTVFAFRLQ